MIDPDPSNTPLIRHVLYTNDVTRLVHSYVAGLLTVARPERVRAAFERLLADWDRTVALNREVAEELSKSRGEPSGWQDPD